MVPFVGGDDSTAVSGGRPNPGRAFGSPRCEQAGGDRPGASVLGRDAYLDIDSKAGALLESIVVNHPLVDGNKRLGWLSVVVFYGLNDIDLQAPDDGAYELVVAVASGRADHLEAAHLTAQWH